MNGGEAEARGERGGTGAGARYIPGIDGIRALAVLGVLAYHLEPRLLPGGFAGVDLFFVISGYVVSLATSTIPARSLPALALAFYRRRVVRILPAALVFLVAIQLASVLFIPRLTGLDPADTAAVLATAGASNFALWWGAADYFSPGPELNPITHTWSLAVEEQFYVLFPALALLLWRRGEQARDRRLGAGFLTVAALASLAGAAWWTRTAPVFAFYMLPARFWELAAGVLLFAAIGGGGARSLPGGVVRAAGLAGPLLLLAAFVWSGAAGFPFPGAIPAVFAGAALIVVCAQAPASPVARVLALPWLRHFGRISYSLYLWHWGVLVLLRWTWGLESPLQKIVAALASWALAWLSWRLVEQPLRRSAWLARTGHGRVVLGGIAGIALAAGAIVALTVLRPALTLAGTGDRDVWSAHRPATDPACPLAITERPLARVGGRLDMIPQGCPGAPSAARLFVIGDSHAMVYRRMLGNLARRDGLASVSLTQIGCPIPPALPQPAAQQAICARFTADALDVVAREARRGDVLFLPGLRNPRYRPIIDGPIVAPPRPRTFTEAQLAAEAARLAPLLDRGVRVIVEGPKPAWNFAPVRCNAWFNRANRACLAPAISYAEAYARPAAARATLARLRAIEPRIELWDPFGLLCSPGACAPWRDGKPLVTDGDHLSGYANDLLTGPFERVLARRGQGSSSDASP